MLMVASAGLCVVLAKRDATPREDRRRWAVLAVVLTAMSLVEATQLREGLMAPVREAFDASGPLYYTWVVPGAAAALLAVAYFLPFVLAQPPHLRARILLAGTCYVTGALVLEMVGGQVVSSGGPDVAFALAQEIEEIAELLGLTVLVTALLGELRGTIVCFGSPEGADAVATPPRAQRVSGPTAP